MQLSNDGNFTVADLTEKHNISKSTFNRSFHVADFFLYVLIDFTQSYTWLDLQTYLNSIISSLRAVMKENEHFRRIKLPEKYYSSGSNS